jgi:flagellar biosynthesis protein FlhG
MRQHSGHDNVIHLNTRNKGALNGQGLRRQRSPGQRPQILTITSGKGGVGKTNIVANIGYALSRLGKRVLILDADLGLGNLDVLLGITPEYNLSHVIQGERSLREIVVEGPGGLCILPAASGIQELTELTSEERYRVFSQLEAFIRDFDIMLIDTAAGISSNVLYFNINADDIFVVATPEPTSITDAYALMKILSVKYDSNQFKLIVNAASSEQEADEVYRQISLVTDRFLDVDIEYFGGIVVDDNLKKGVRKQMVVSELAPMSHSSRSFSLLARKIAGRTAQAASRPSHNWVLTDFPG